MPSSEQDLIEYCQQLGRNARSAEQALRQVTGAQKNQWLEQCAEALLRESQEILEANQEDLNAAEANGLTRAQIDRLRLTPQRIEAMAAALREIARLPEPVGQVLESRSLPSGLRVDKVSVPLGVIFFIYESRPNVTVDAASICVKSGNAVVLRGGKEARCSNQKLHEILQNELEEVGMPRHAVQRVELLDREAVGHLLRMKDAIDLVIPRGGESLIRRVESEATMHVLKHYQGNCHIYIDASADLDMAEAIVVNAKCQRPGVCNAAESLLVHKDIAEAILPRVGQALLEKGVELRGCERAQRLVEKCGPATEEDYATEYLDLILSIKVVDDLQEALSHISRYGSQHTECIVTNDLAAARRFTTSVDSSAVMVNASTRFNDGGELGLGAEIGISTDKFHARGPCGLLELTCYKYIVHGDGQIRS